MKWEDVVIELIRSMWNCKLRHNEKSTVKKGLAKFGNIIEKDFILHRFYEFLAKIFIGLHNNNNEILLWIFGKNNLICKRILNEIFQFSIFQFIVFLSSVNDRFYRQCYFCTDTMGIKKLGKFKIARRLQQRTIVCSPLSKTTLG